MFDLLKEDSSSLNQVRYLIYAVCKQVVELNLGSEMPHLSQVRVIDPTTGTIGNTDVGLFFSNTFLST